MQKNKLSKEKVMHLVLGNLDFSWLWDELQDQEQLGSRKWGILEFVL